MNRANTLQPPTIDLARNGQLTNTTQKLNNTFTFYHFREI